VVRELSSSLGKGSLLGREVFEVPFERILCFRRRKRDSVLLSRYPSSLLDM
jgi:hypothetical protein